MQQKKNIIYLLSLGISVLASLKISISYALLNIFIPEENLPLELGIARILGEQGAYIINLIINTIIWFVIFTIGRYVYKRLRPKKFIIFTIFSFLLWIIATYAIVFINIFILGNFKIDIFGSPCSGTGYPISRSVCLEDVLYAFYFLNILFWFLVVWFTWEQLLKKIFHLRKN